MGPVLVCHFAVIMFEGQVAGFEAWLMSSLYLSTHKGVWRRGRNGVHGGARSSQDTARFFPIVCVWRVILMSQIDSSSIRQTTK